MPAQETDNEMWETWKADHHATQIQTYFEKRGKYTIYSEKDLVDERKYADKKKPKSWDTLSEIIVQGSWDAVYADSEAEFWKCINKELSTKAYKAGYQECMEYSMKQVKETLNEKEK